MATPDIIQLRRQAAYIKKALFEQGFLDDQFLHLEELQDDSNPNFVEEVVNLFFRDSARMMSNIEGTLEKTPVDFKKLDKYIHNLKGSSSSIGALKIKNECTVLRENCVQGNVEGPRSMTDDEICMRSFQQVKKEHGTLKKKFEAHYQLLRQAGPYESASRPA